VRSITDVFIKHPVLAVVVNLVLVLVGWRAIGSLPVQQYPKLDSSSIVVTTVYYGASAETVRGFLTTPIERAVSAVSGIDQAARIMGIEGSIRGSVLERLSRDARAAQLVLGPNHIHRIEVARKIIRGK